MKTIKIERDSESTSKTIGTSKGKDIVKIILFNPNRTIHIKRSELQRILN